jgi:hypothetical protein
VLCADDVKDGDSTIQSILEERPAILRQIKGLEIDLKIPKSQNDFCEDIDKYGYFNHWCDYVAEKWTAADGDEDDHDDYDSDEDWDEQLKAKYQAAVLELMMPFSLRS